MTLQQQGLGNNAYSAAPEQSMGNIIFIDPLSYLNFPCLMAHARLVLAASEGIEEETTGLDVPCLTPRENTEMPTTTLQGTNRSVRRDKTAIINAGRQVLEAPSPPGKAPNLWDGMAARRIVRVLRERLGLRHYEGC
jgi:UDP-N-acetylglucosamine 2-epimerase (non-hydrolysing)